MRRLVDSIVPCNGCTACCTDRSAVMLFPEMGDDPAVLSKHSMTQTPKGEMPILDFKENGDCVYLGEAGCSVWQDRPVMCRVYDCRDQYRTMSRAERKRGIKSGILSKKCLDAGRERLHTLTEAEG